LLETSTTILVGGDFSTLAGASRKSLGEVDKTAGTITAFNAALDGSSCQVYGAYKHGNGDFYVSGTEPASTTTARTPTHDRAFNETAITTSTVQGNNYMYRVDPTWNINSRYGSIRPYQYGTDGNKYVRSSWSASI
jgi:hypothetical protein